MVARIPGGDFEIDGAVSWIYCEYGRLRFLDPDAPHEPWQSMRKRTKYGIGDVAMLEEVAVESTSSAAGSLGPGAPGALALGAGASCSAPPWVA